MLNFRLYDQSGGVCLRYVLILDLKSVILYGSQTDKYRRESDSKQNSDNKFIIQLIKFLENYNNEPEQLVIILSLPYFEVLYFAKILSATSF